VARTHPVNVSKEPESAADADGLGETAPGGLKYREAHGRERDEDPWHVDGGEDRNSTLVALASPAIGLDGESLKVRSCAYKHPSVLSWNRGRPLTQASHPW